MSFLYSTVTPQRSAESLAALEPDLEPVNTEGSVNEHDNDSLFYRAIEPDSLIAVLFHFLIVFLL